MFATIVAWQVCNSTGQRTPAIYQSYLPDERNHPAYTAQRTRTRTYKNAQHTAAHATMDVRSRHRTSPRSTRFVLGKASECRRRSRSCHVDPLSRRREVAHGVLCPSPKPEHFFFSLRREERSRFFVVCFLHTSRRHTFDLDTEYTHGQRASRRARPVNIDGDLRNFMWTHGVGVERLLVMSYALCPNSKNSYFLYHRRWIEILCHLLSTHQRSNVFFLDSLQAPAIYHRPSCEVCDPRMGRSP